MLYRKFGKLILIVLTKISSEDEAYSFEDMYFANSTKIASYNYRSNALFTGIYNSMTEVHDRLTAAKNYKMVKKQATPLMSNGVCANVSCERVYTHYALYCNFCKQSYCVYCDVVSSHEKKHGFEFQSKY